jgi:rare lipoprotein A
VELQSANSRFVAFAIAAGALVTAASFSTQPAVASQCGHASFYSYGPSTASGEPMNANAMAAAHPTLPFGTMVRVDDLANGRSVTVRINDRGPFVRGRVIDLTRAAAQQLGMVDAGTAPVRLTVVGGGGAQLTGCT